MKNKKSKLNIQKQQLDIPVVSGSVNLTGIYGITNSLITDKTTTDTTIWKGGYVTDNFHSYYLDENMVKHYH
jgi:hypothetical protein